jgi:hypothetical protein
MCTEQEGPGVDVLCQVALNLNLVTPVIQIRSHDFLTPSMKTSGKHLS